MAATFTITQTPASKDLWLYPSGDVSGSTALTHYGDNPNYLCIDELRTVPDVDTYVYTAGVSVITDMYSLPDHTTETGAINYVQVFARAKSNIYPQSGTGRYAILLADNSSSTANSGDIALTTGYQTYNNLWTSNPTDSTTWTWADIDHMQIGLECSSPTVQSQTKTLILRPNAEGDTTDFIPVGASWNWDCVNEEIADDDDTYVDANYGLIRGDDYQLPDHTTETGTITKVTVFGRMKRIASGPIGGIGVKLGGTRYYAEFRPPTTYTNYSKSWTSSPTDDTTAFTWTDIDNLQLTLTVRNSRLWHTQAYIVVEYTEDENPEIRTTQCHAKVNYTPGSTTTYLNVPINYTLSHSREIKMMNFYDGTRAVFDRRRSGKTLSMSGVEWNTSSIDVETRLDNVKDLENNRTAITISGMLDNNLNTTWLIRHFDYSQDEGNPNLYYWNMTCEATT